MDRKHIYLLILVPLIFCIFFTFPPLTGESASVKTTLDAKYTRRDSTQTDLRDKDHEYNPRLSVQYSHPLTQWTNLSGEAQFNYKEEKEKEISSDEVTRTEEVTRTKEPQIELRLKSLIYDIKTGFKETRIKNESTENRIFGHFLIQPSRLPEFRVDYDRDETKNQLEKDRITLGSIYKPSKILRIKLDFKYEHTKYERTNDITKSNPDIEDFNLNGEIKFNHTLSTRRPIKTEISYKAEKLRQEEEQPSETKQDEFLHTLRGKLSYRPTKKTDISLEYEYKGKDDRKKDGEDKSNKDIKFDISQNFTDWLEVRGWIREESEEEQDPNNIIDTEKTTLNGHIRAAPKKWLQLNLKAVDEKSKELNSDSFSGEKTKRILEASLRSDFPNLLRSYQTLDFKKDDEDKPKSTSSEEERFMWKWSLSPIDNLSLKPEYIRSVKKKIESESEEKTTDKTYEKKLNFGYKFSVHDTWTVNLSHATSRKKVETRFEDPNDPDTIQKSHKETNDDSSLEVDFQPYESLFITSQITRKYYRIKGDNPSRSREMSYSFKFDWSFNPFTWSTSYKYDDKKDQNDTETFESKILYDFTDYTIEVEYKFTQTFLSPKDKEDLSPNNKENIITLRFKLVF